MIVSWIVFFPISILSNKTTVDAVFVWNLKKNIQNSTYSWNRHWNGILSVRISYWIRHWNHFNIRHCVCFQSYAQNLDRVLFTFSFYFLHKFSIPSIRTETNFNMSWLELEQNPEPDGKSQFFSFLYSPEKTTTRKRSIAFHLDWFTFGIPNSTQWEWNQQSSACSFNKIETVTKWDFPFGLLWRGIFIFLEPIKHFFVNVFKQ